MEYVLRPQTLPQGMTELAVTGFAFRPRSGQLTTSDGMSYTFRSNLNLGLWASQGVTDRIEVGFSAPRVMCWSRSEPSGCNEVNRYNGTGPSLTYGILRSPQVQLKVYGGLFVARSSQPLTWAWTIGGRTKILVGHVLALEVAVDLSRRLEPGASQPDRSTRGSAVAEVDFQATRHLTIFAVANPYAPTDHLGKPAVELRGGAAWAFRNLSQVVASAGTNNVLADRSWNDGVPGTFYRISMVFWF